MKAIVVIDMPESCDECPCYYKDFFVCRVAKKENENWYGTKPNWCPLKSMPNRDPISDEEIASEEDYEVRKFCGAFNLGWNNCLDEIGGQDEDTI